MTTRRSFIQQSSLLAFSTLIPFSANKSYQMGYSAITWSGNDEQAIMDIASLGFKGIQLRANSFPVYKDDPSVLKAKLDAAKLKLVMFSSGNVEIDPAKEMATIEQHVNHAKFVKALGGTSIQLTNSLRKKGVLPTEAELVRLAQVMNEIGKRTKEIGIQTTYHNHMNQFGETPEEVETLVKNMNPAYAKLLLDVAHYFQGGGNPAEAVLKYKDVIHAFYVPEFRLYQDMVPGRVYDFVWLKAEATGSFQLACNQLCGQGHYKMFGKLSVVPELDYETWAKSKTPPPVTMTGR
jgi:inosose dehydratase